MRCPHDDVSLVTTERGGVEIDYCPICRGVWLERGELDRLTSISPEFMASDFEERSPNAEHNIQHHRKGFLRDLFEF